MPSLTRVASSDSKKSSQGSKTPKTGLGKGAAEKKTEKERARVAAADSFKVKKAAAWPNKQPSQRTAEAGLPPAPSDPMLQRAHLKAQWEYSTMG